VQFNELQGRIEMTMEMALASAEIAHEIKGHILQFVNERAGMSM
jgi:hypothetical protein